MRQLNSDDAFTQQMTNSSQPNSVAQIGVAASPCSTINFHSFESVPSLSMLALEFFDKHLSGKSAAALALAVRAAREPFADLAKARLEDVEALYLEKLMATRDANEGLQAFIDKRPPSFRGR